MALPSPVVDPPPRATTQSAPMRRGMRRWPLRSPRPACASSPPQRRRPRGRPGARPSACACGLLRAWTGPARAASTEPPQPPRRRMARAPGPNRTLTAALRATNSWLERSHRLPRPPVSAHRQLPRADREIDRKFTPQNITYRYETRLRVTSKSLPPSSISGGLTEGAAALGQVAAVRLAHHGPTRRHGSASPLFQPNRRPLQPTELGVEARRAAARASCGQTRRRARSCSSYREGSFRRRAHRGHADLHGRGDRLDDRGVPARAIPTVPHRPVLRLCRQTRGAALRNGTLDMAILPLHRDPCPEGAEFCRCCPA